MAKSTKKVNNYTIQKMQKCKNEGYDCESCEFAGICKVAKWECICCGKFTNYGGAYKQTFGKS